MNLYDYSISEESKKKVCAKCKKHLSEEERDIGICDNCLNVFYKEKSKINIYEP